MKNKKLVAFIVFILIALSLTLYLLQRQQEIRSRATGETVSLRLTPETAPAPVPVGTTFPVEVSVANSGYDITGVDITIQYDTDHLEITNRTPGTTFADTLLNTIDTANGSIRFVAVNSTTTPITTASIPVVTLTVHARAAGVGTIGFTNTEIVAVNNNTFLPIGNNSTGSYTVGTSASPTLPATTPTPTLSPTPSPTPMLTPIPSQPTASPAQPSATLTPVPTTSACSAPATRQTGDADNDNCATVGDFIVWKFEFIEEAAGRTTTRQSNFDNDDRISVGDFIIWKNTFINGSSTQ